MRIVRRWHRPQLRAVEHLGAEWRDPGGHQLSVDSPADRRDHDRIRRIGLGDGGHGQVEHQVARWRTKGIKLNVGAEYRSESAVFSPDLASEEGNAEGSGGPTVPVVGQLPRKEIFTELGIPLLDHKPVAESLGLEVGYRYSDYNLGFKTNTYKFGGRVGADERFPRSRQLLARGARAEHRRTVRAAGGGAGRIDRSLRRRRRPRARRRSAC